MINKLTFITPTLNCHSTIEDTLNSIVLLQRKYPGMIFHIIGDGGSIDGTLEILKKYVQNNNFANLKNYPKLNIPATLNKLLLEVETNCLAVINGDDYINVDSFDLIIKYMLNNELLMNDMICSSLNVVDSNKKIIGKRLSNPLLLKNFMSINHPTLIFSKEVLITYPFFENYKFNYDYVWMWFVHNKIKINFKVFELFVISMRKGGISEAYVLKAQLEILKFKWLNKFYCNALRNFILFIIKQCLKKIIPNYIILKIRGSLNSLDRTN
jgi:glycosyltransferase involved in cell wall biosynthesis